MPPEPPVRDARHAWTRTPTLDDDRFVLWHCRDPKGVRIRFEKVRAFELFLSSPVDCAKMVDAVAQAHEGVIHAEQEAEALKRSVQQRVGGFREAGMRRAHTDFGRCVPATTNRSPSAS